MINAMNVASQRCGNNGVTSSFLTYIAQCAIRKDLNHLQQMGKVSL